MRHDSPTLTGGRGSRSIGVVSGFVLKLARQSAKLTQDRLAEALAVDVTTVQAWESGRRPLAAMNAGEFLRLCNRLSRLGAPASTGRHLREAIEADQILSTGITASTAWVDPDSHPLAAGVHRLTLTILITWPFLRNTPQHLREFGTFSRRGPAAAHPAIGDAERTRFFNHLLTIAERASGPKEALLRRQAVYLLGFDGRPGVVEWLGAEWSRAGRRRVKDGDITGLLEARSASVALAVAGDGTYLYDFLRCTTDTGAEIANLNYWAHWIGELSEEQTSDAFMFDADTRSWTGVRLLRHLVGRLSPESPHLPLNLHTLHALIASRPSLLNGRPTARIAVAEVVDALASSVRLSRVERDQIAGIQYALRIADR